MKLRTFLMCLTLITILSCPVIAMKNPSAVYCEELGYEYVVQVTEEGEMGYCKLPDGKNVSAWEFLEGKVAQEYSYCERKGYVIKTVKDSEKCLKFLADECAVCVLKDETEVEVTEIMELNFEETTCGDGICGIPENYGTCSKDCHSGTADMYCDGIHDRICDPDCGINEDIDCKKLNETINTSDTIETPELIKNFQLLKRNYTNIQCYFGYDTCSDTVVSLKHEMYETITLDPDVITYSTYTNYIPLAPLRNKDNGLVDSGYRGKMIFLGGEYFVKNWDDDKKILTLAKAEERKLDNKAFGREYKTINGNTYKFRINDTLLSKSGNITGIVIDIKKPDGTIVQTTAGLMRDAVVKDIRIYVSNVAAAGKFIQTDIVVYDLNTELKLADNNVLDTTKWYVKMDYMPVGCLADIGNDGKYNCPTGIEEPSDADRIKFKNYKKADLKYENKEILGAIHITLKSDTMLLKGNYKNIQCELCYGISNDTVVDLLHSMHERVVIKPDYITYSVFTDYIPKTHLMNKNSELVDSQYNGKMIFLGEEYFVKWSKDNLELARGAKININNKEFGGNFAAKNGDKYRFKIERALVSGTSSAAGIVSETNSAAGIIIDVKKPDGTVVQVFSRKSGNAVIGDIEIYTTQVVVRGEFVQAEVIVYDLKDKITLTDNKNLAGTKWSVKLDYVPLKCLVNLDDADKQIQNITQINNKPAILPVTDYSKSDTRDAQNEDILSQDTSNNGYTCPHGIIEPTTRDRETKSLYGNANPEYENESMIREIRLTLKTKVNGSEIIVGNKIKIPFDMVESLYAIKTPKVAKQPEQMQMQEPIIYKQSPPPESDKDNISLLIIIGAGILISILLVIYFMFGRNKLDAPNKNQ